MYLNFLTFVCFCVLFLLFICLCFFYNSFIIFFLSFLGWGGGQVVGGQGFCVIIYIRSVVECVFCTATTAMTTTATIMTTTTLTRPSFFGSYYFSLLDFLVLIFTNDCQNMYLLIIFKCYFYIYMYYVCMY